MGVTPFPVETSLYSSPSVSPWTSYSDEQTLNVTCHVMCPAWHSELAPITLSPLVSLGHHMFTRQNHGFSSTAWLHVSSSSLISWIQCLNSWSRERPWHCTVGFDPQPVTWPLLYLQSHFEKTLSPHCEMTWNGEHAPQLPRHVSTMSPDMILLQRISP